MNVKIGTEAMQFLWNICFQFSVCVFAAQYSPTMNPYIVAEILLHSFLLIMSIMLILTKYHSVPVTKRQGSPLRRSSATIPYRDFNVLTFKLALSG
jgi:hypothetical protein